MPNNSKTFRQLVVHLSDHFGNLNLGIDYRANSLEKLLPHDGVQRQTVHAILQSIYQNNQCGDLDSAVSLEHTFDGLGDLGWALRSCDETGVDEITLLEQVGECLAVWFQHGNRARPATPKKPVKQGQTIPFRP